MALQEGRFTASAEGRSKGVTLLVPRQVVEAEQRELMDYIRRQAVQNLIVFLRRGGLRHLDVNEPIRNGEHKGLNPLHVAINKTNASSSRRCWSWRPAYRLTRAQRRAIGRSTWRARSATSGWSAR